MSATTAASDEDNSSDNGAIETPFDASQNSESSEIDYITIAEKFCTDNFANCGNDFADTQFFYFKGYEFFSDFKPEKSKIAVDRSETNSMSYYCDTVLVLVVDRDCQFSLNVRVPINLPIAKQTLDLLQQNRNGTILAKNCVDNHFYDCKILSLAINRAEELMLFVFQPEFRIVMEDNFYPISNVLASKEFNIERYPDFDYIELKNKANECDNHKESLLILRHNFISRFQYEQKFNINLFFKKEMLLKTIEECLPMLPHHRYLSRMTAHDLVDAIKSSLFFRNETITNSINLSNLQKIIENIEKMKGSNFLCKFCDHPLVPYRYLISFKKMEYEGVQYHTNPNQSIFALISFMHDHKKKYEFKFDISTEKFEEFTWFKNYAWRVLLCHYCDSHVGWLYEPIKKYFVPDPKFICLIL